MSQLPEETIAIVLDLQRRLLVIISEVTTEFTLFERYGEKATLTVFEQLQNAIERVWIYYSRFSILL